MRTTRAVAVLPLVLVLAACGGGDDSPEISAQDPDSAGLRLFELAREGEPETSDVDLLFGPVADEMSRARLLDALEALHPSLEPRIVGRTARAGGIGPVQLRPRGDEALRGDDRETFAGRRARRTSRATRRRPSAGTRARVARGPQGGPGDDRPGPTRAHAPRGREAPLSPGLSRRR